MKYNIFLVLNSMRNNKLVKYIVGCDKICRYIVWLHICIRYCKIGCSMTPHILNEYHLYCVYRPIAMHHLKSRGRRTWVCEKKQKTKNGRHFWLVHNSGNDIRYIYNATYDEISAPQKTCCVVLIDVCNLEHHYMQNWVSKQVYLLKFVLVNKLFFWEVS